MSNSSSRLQSGDNGGGGWSWPAILTGAAIVFLLVASCS